MIFRGLCALIPGFVLPGLVLLGCRAPERAPVAGTPKPGTPKPAPLAAPRLLSVEDENGLAPEVLARCKAATVLIGNFEGGKLGSTGSGVVLSDGRTVVTNRHVVVGEDEAPDALKLVFFAGTERARIVEVRASAVSLLAAKAADAKDYDADDVAAIRLPALVAPPLDVAKDADAQETASAWSLGFPNGMEIRRGEDELPGPTIHSLRIERVERKGGAVSVLQFGGSVTYGDSGGPVVTRRGEVLGLMQALADRRSSIVYAVPGGAIRQVVARAKRPGGAGGAGKTLVSRFTADLGASPDEAPKATPEPRKPKTPDDPGPIEGATSSLATRDLDDETLDALTPILLTMLRNEPFARRGYIFRRAAIRRFYANTAWYTPRTRDMAAVERRFTARERRNVNRIADYQKSTGKQW